MYTYNKQTDMKIFMRYSMCTYACVTMGKKTGGNVDGCPKWGLAPE